jgi:glycine/D-amino acid oxidase-like deaminating enzyme
LTGTSPRAAGAVAVVGAGPLGAATAYGLARAGVPGVTLVGGDPVPGAYRSSGGSVCWHRADPEKSALIKATADFVTARVAAGARIGVRETPYLFLDAGVLVPALNITAADLVADLVGLALAGGVERADVGEVTGLERLAGGHRVVGDAGTVEARVVVLALGTGNAALTGSTGELEARQLYVLDLPVDADRARLPHVVAPVGAGYAYVFVKRTPAGLRLLLGQEDLVTDSLDGPVDRLAELLDAGVADRFPFLRGAAAERLLWGVDHEAKLPVLAEPAPGLLTVNCGSAVRACVPIGERVAAAVRDRLWTVPAKLG